jgi:hypothetical protein
MNAFRELLCLAVPAVVATLLTALTFGACAEGVAGFEADRRVKQDAAWLEQQPDVVVCRVDESDLGYGFAQHKPLVSKVPSHDEYEREHLDCAGLLNLDMDMRRDLSFVPEQVKLVQYNRAREDDHVDNLRAIQWMHLHPDVKACTIVIQSSEAELNSWLVLFPGYFPEAKRTVLIRNCDGHVIWVTHPEIPPGTPTCGQADIPACGTASPSAP